MVINHLYSGSLKVRSYSIKAIVTVAVALALSFSFMAAPASKASALTCGGYGQWYTTKAYKFQAGTWCMQVQYQTLIWQSDGNLVQYTTIGGSRSVHWATNTAGRGYWLAFQTDGNLVIYDAGNHAIWANGARGTAGYTRFTLNMLNGGALYENESNATSTRQLWYRS